MASGRQVCLYLQTMAILAELGAPRLAAVLGVEHEQVSLAACNLLHVMFDSLKEGLQKDFRGKEDAVVLGECGLPWLAVVRGESHIGARGAMGLFAAALSLLPTAQPKARLWSRVNRRQNLLVMAASLPAVPWRG